MEMDIADLVDADRGLIGRRIFIEPEIYDQELQRIFARCWLFLCHERGNHCARQSYRMTGHFRSWHYNFP